MSANQKLPIRPASWKLLLAFAIIYIVWGSTYLAIRVGVREIPPLLMAAMRFAVAGFVLYGWARLRGAPAPTRREWVSASLMASMVFLCDYGCLFWAEQRVPSGIAAVVLATIPVFITISEIILLRTQHLTLRLAISLLIGIAGVAVLVNHSTSFGEAPINRAGAAALLFSAVSWSIATVLTRKVHLPESKTMSSAAQMASGGVQLLIAAALAGEFQGFHVRAVSGAAWFAVFYLIVAGSIIGYTAYLWLLYYESPTKVGTYAYVNPVVAVVVGYFLGGEQIGSRTILGMALVLVSVIAITTIRAKAQQKPSAAEEVPPASSPVPAMEAE
jgi:drug/metabolite transporter (DMT)-like permease